MKFRGGISELMRQASRMQRKVEKRKEELKEETFEATGGNGQVKVIVNGALEVTQITIDPEFIKNEELSMVQDLVAATVNAALTKGNEMVDAEIEKITGGMKIPGLM